MTDREKYMAKIFAILLLVIGVSFAYFIAEIHDEKQVDVNLISDKLDNLTYTVDKDISLTINQFNLASGEGNVTDSSVATIAFKANKTKNQAEAYYNLYFYIESNPYIYTTEDKKPEILLNIYNSSNEEITNIDSLDYVSATNANGVTLNGFDITERAGLFKVTLNNKITSNSSVIATNQTWKVTLTFINLENNQIANEDKTLKAKMILNDKTYKTKISEVCQSGDNLANCIISLHDSSETIATNIYHHDGTLENGINDGSYRYAGASDVVHNFVCFGSDAEECPTDNLYRIIGVFDGKIKLIKSDYATSALLGTDGDYSTDTFAKSKNSTYKGELTTINAYYWNYKALNSPLKTWNNSLLNKTNLNTNFLNKIGNTWTSKIAITTWKVDGGTTTNIRNLVPSIAYQYEVGANASATTYDAKIGLIYASDYVFAAAPSAWTTHLNCYGNLSITSVNWMYMGFTEWTITISPEEKDYVFFIGYVGDINTNLSYAFVVRPCFYLENNIIYISGSGTSQNPIRLS